jgi:hypothetical protein
LQTYSACHLSMKIQIECSITNNIILKPFPS